MVDTSCFQDKKAAYYTLGCKLNFSETSTLARLLREAGVREVRRGEVADLCIINTCSVTEVADKKCRQAIHAARRRHPGARIVVTGCYAQLKPEAIARMEGVDLVLGAEQKGQLPRYLARLLEHPADESCRGAFVSPFRDIRSFAPSCSCGGRTRYFLKVQDGCDYFCSYCTIPLARGRSRNAPVRSLQEQAGKVAAEGGKEIVLTGVNIGDFGKTTGERFIDLLRALDRVEGIERYRVSSLEPDLIGGDVIDFMAASRKFMPHFHIPLQSGSDEVLRLMRRRYDTALFASLLDRIHAAMPDVFIGIDVIVGMRGETESLFRETYDFLSRSGFAQLHVFSYSERPGTKALQITPIVPPEVKHERSRLLLDLSEKKTKDFYRRHIGRAARVLWEHARPGEPMHGFTENYIRVERPDCPELDNHITDVRLGGFNSDETALLLASGGSGQD